MTSPIFSAIESGVPTSSIDELLPPSAASCRSVLPLPNCWNLSSDPCSPLVVSFPGSGLSRSYFEKSMSVNEPNLASEYSTNADEVTNSVNFSRAFRLAEERRD
jgi:hypothetical protein